ncbi:MAG TPA: hypothetical protein VGO98_00465 [Candidatus Saccharimonadales bacterium]|jgi:hypothetical protein|nr:hypothetical protein [Candidatus Saccharimonadales bacterium]
MSAELLSPKNQETSWLPPQEMWLHDPEKDGYLETPTDQYGLVDLDKLVTLVKGTVSPEFSWESPFNDVHHLQWYARNYPVAIGKNDAVNMNEFRELINRKAFISRVFHNRAHQVTLPPRVPSEEVMRHSIRAERTALQLYRTARLATKLTRMPHIPERKLIQRLNEEYENYTLYIENAREVPKEFSLIAIEEVEARSVDEMLLVNKRLGKLALDTIPVRHRQILQAA